MTQCLLVCLGGFGQYSIWSIFTWAVFGERHFGSVFWYVFGDLVNILFGQYLPGPFLEQRHFGRMLYVSAELVKILFSQYLPEPFLERRRLGSVIHGYLGQNSI